MADFQPTVTLSSPLNSTLFTTCCGVAIGEETSNCPACKRLVLPLTRDARWEHVRHMDRIREKGAPHA